MKVLLNLLKFLGLIYQNGRVLWSFQATCLMPMTKRNIHTVPFVFDSSQGTPCIFIRSLLPTLHKKPPKMENQSLPLSWTTVSCGVHVIFGLV